MEKIIEAKSIRGSQILVVERELWVKKQVTYVLQNAGYEVMGIVDSSSIPLLLDSQFKSRIDFDLVILADISERTSQSHEFDLPSVSSPTNCLQACQWLHHHHKLIPVLVVSDKKSEIDLILALEMGADIYLTTPISSRELTVRCHNLIRRYGGCWQKSPCLSFKDIQLYPQEGSLMIRGKEVLLTPNEFFLLEIMMQEPCRVWTREELCWQIWEKYSEQNVQRLTRFFYYFRKKIELNPRQPEYLITANGIGYRFG